MRKNGQNNNHTAMLKSLRRRIMIQNEGGGDIKGIYGDGVAYLDFSFLDGLRVYDLTFRALIDWSYWASFTGPFTSAVVDGGMNHIFVKTSRGFGLVSAGAACNFKDDYSVLKGIYGTENTSRTACVIKLYDENFNVLKTGSGAINSQRYPFTNTKCFADRMTIYWLEILDRSATNLLYRFIPMLKNGEVGLFEELSNTFKGNAAGAGHFTPIYEN